MAADPKVAYSLICKHQTLGESQRQDIDQHMAWYEGEFWTHVRGQKVASTAVGWQPSNDDDLNFETNYPYAFIDTMIANVCPTNPEITITARLEDAQEAARERQYLINDTFKRMGLHDIVWDASVRAALAGYCPLKTVWDEKRQMPMTRFVDPRAFFWDRSVPFDSTRYAIQADAITMAEFNRRKRQSSEFHYSTAATKLVAPSGFPKWLTPLKTNQTAADADAARDEMQWVLVYEFWDFDNGCYYHFADGVDKPLISLKELPYKYICNPYRNLVFNKSIKDTSGVSDVKLIARALQRMNELDTIELNYAHRSVPITVINQSLVDDYDELVEAINNAGPNDVVALKGRNEAPISAILGSTGVPELLVPFEVMRDRCERVISFTLGLPQYARGEAGASDVATELALMDTATRTRNGRRVKVVGDLISGIAKDVGALYQEFLPEDRQLPIRKEGQEFEYVTRKSMNLDNDRATKEYNANIWDESWYYDYEVVDFSPTENHRLVQLNKAVQFNDFLSGNPFVNQGKRTKKILELLGMEELYDEDQGMQEQQAMQAQMQQAAGASGGIPIEGTPADVISTGAMPPGADVEEMSNVDARSMAG